MATTNAPIDPIREAYYKVTRVADNNQIISFSTGSVYAYSKLSYDISGSFFEIDMSIFESDYLYEVAFLRKEGKDYIEQPEKFRFRVE